jgi:hypothetical protein
MRDAEMNLEFVYQEAKEGYEYWTHIEGRLTNSERAEKEKAYRKYESAARALDKYRSFHHKQTPNGKTHRQAGRRSAEAKSERLSNLLDNVAGWDPALMPLARKWNHKIPKTLNHMSRFEAFQQMVEEDPDAQYELAEKVLGGDVKRYAKEQQAYEDDRLEYLPPADEDDYYDYLAEQGEEMSDEEVGRFANYLHDILSEREVSMLSRVLSKEGGMSDRQLTCFYRAAKKKLKRNGSLWR